jgi:WD40 repeat protein
MPFDGFISYSHAADGRLAPAVQRGLHSLAKPWHRRRALYIFRDQTGLSVTPALWTSIRQALDGSNHFVLLASPEAARSPWVNREIEHWVSRKDPGRILPVVTDGTWQWDPAAHDFTADSTAVPEALRGVFAEEPLYLDLRWARDDRHLNLRHSRFRDAIAQLAAPMHGVTKDDLEGEDVRQHRRARRLSWAAVTTLLLLTVVAVVTGLSAMRNAERANAAADDARRQQLVAAEQRGNAERSAGEASRQQHLAQQQETRAREAAAEARKQEGLARRQKALVAAATTQVERQQATARYQRALAAGAAAKAQEQRALAQGQRAAAEQATGQARRQQKIAREQERRAGAAAEEASRQERRAQEQERKAQEQERRAQEQERRAQEQERKAQEQEIRAREAAEEARKQRETAISRRLINQAKATSESDATLALRLGVAAAHLQPDAETRGELVGLVGSTRFAGSLQGAEDVAFGRDGVVALAASNGPVTLWDTRDRLRPVLISDLGNAGYERSLTFSPDRRTLAFIDTDRAVLWDLKQARPAKVGELPRAGLVGLAIGQDGDILAAQGKDGSVTLWNISEPATPRELGTLPDGVDLYADMVFSSNGRTLLTKAAEHPVVWDVSDPGRPIRVSDLPSRIHKVAGHHGAPIVAVAEFAGNVTLYDISDPAAIRSAGSIPVPGMAADVAVDPTGTLVAVTDFSGEVTLWSVGIAQPIKLDGTLPRHGARSIGFSEDGRTVATTGVKTLLWNVGARGAPHLVADLFGHRAPVLTAAYRSGGRTLVTADAGGNARFWEVSEGGQVAHVSAQIADGHFVGAAISPDGRLLALMRKTGAVVLADVTDPEAPALVGTFSAPASFRLTATFSPDGRTLAVLGYGVLTLWDVADPTDPDRLGVLEDPRLIGQHPTFSPDGRTVAVATGQTVLFVDVTDPAILTYRNHPAGLELEQPSAVAWSPDGRTLAIGSYDKNLTLWDVTNGGRAYRLASMPNTISSTTSLAFSPDGHTLAAGIGDQTLILWDVTTRTRPLRFAAARRGNSGTGALVMSPDGRSLATAGTFNPVGSVASVWDYSELVRLRADPTGFACAVTGRGLDADEWARIIPELPYRPTCGG